jgi:hypothetical protein
MSKIFSVAEDRDGLLKSILQIEHFYNDPENLERKTRERYLSGRKKHNRRRADEIARQLKCPYAQCNKFYASEGSLNLHIKLKHNGGNKTDREKIAKSIVFAKANGIELNKDIGIHFNLPPGLIEKAASSIGVDLDDGSIENLESEVIKANEETRIKMKQE